MVRNLLSAFLSVISSKILINILAFIITPLLVRYLGSGGYGDYAFLLSVIGISMILINAGISDGLRKYIAERDRGPNWPEKVFSYYVKVAIGLAISSLLIFVLAISSGVVDSVLGHQFELYFLIIGVLLIFKQVHSICQSALRGLELERYSEPLLVLHKILFGCVSLFLLWLGWGVTGVLIGHVIASITISLIGLLILSTQLSLQTIFQWTYTELPVRELVSFNMMSILLILLTSSLYHVDILFLRILTDSQQTGYYKSALFTVEILWIIPIAMQSILVQSTSRISSQNREDDISTLASQVVRYALIVTLIMSIGLAFLAEDFITVYFGSEFVVAVTALILLLPGTLGFAIARPIFAIGQGKGTIHLLVLATGAAAVLNVLLNCILIPIYGITGAAIATSIGYGSMLGLHILTARRIGFDPIEDIRLIPVGASACISGIVIYYLSWTITDGILSLILIPPIGAIIYFMLLIKFGAVSANEVLMVIDYIPLIKKNKIRNIVGKLL
ncbi:oligosaccharide flippase family protein [Natronorubrum sp. DTA7]|uniref:oligosaccharide flippase family protein n=1 Tax=Natronorubrum sp. DTA7 TaxID=3447016 RepID=UPI003F83952D